MVNNVKWHNGYRGAQRNLFVSNSGTFKKRLSILDFFSLPRDSKILDFGCGDGTLLAFLHEQGFTNCVGIEPDSVLATLATSKTPFPIINASGPGLPFEKNSFDAILSMAVLHHLPSAESLKSLMQDFHRVLHYGGRLYYVEPANTIWRRVFTSILMGPLSNLTAFSRQKRLMVEEEWETLENWLFLEKQFVRNFIEPEGFITQIHKRSILKAFYTATKKHHEQ